MTMTDDAFISKTELRALAAVISLALLGCGSTTINNVSSCGPGTTPVDGTCVAVDAAGNDTSSVSTDSAMGGDAVAGDSSPSEDSVVPDGTTPAGDPCPASPPNINCSSSCGGPSANCSLVRCQSDLMTVFKVPYKSLPFVVRLPDKPGFDPKCPESCLEFPRTAFGVMLNSDYFAEATGMRIRVSPPWTISRNNAGMDFCALAPLGSGNCFVLKGTGGDDILISTSDPNAPARNVVFEKGESCP